MSVRDWILFDPDCHILRRFLSNVPHQIDLHKTEIINGIESWHISVVLEYDEITQPELDLRADLIVIFSPSSEISINMLHII